MPAAVMMSMPSLSAEWFSAGKVSRTMRIERMTSRDGSEPPLKPSMRTRAAPPAISTSCRISSFGSSERVSISSSVSSVASVLFGFGAAACGSCPTSTVSVNAGQLELDLLLVVAGAQPHVGELDRIEARELRLDRCSGPA